MEVKKMEDPEDAFAEQTELAKLDMVSPDKFSRRTTDLGLRRTITKKYHHEEEKLTTWQKIKKFVTANEPEQKVDDDEETERNIKLKKINHLTEGDIFGEISLITKLRRTASVFSQSNVTCGFIPKKKFKILLQENHEFKD